MAGLRGDSPGPAKPTKPHAWLVVLGVVGFLIVGVIFGKLPTQFASSEIGNSFWAFWEKYRLWIGAVSAGLWGLSYNLSKTKKSGSISQETPSDYSDVLPRPKGLLRVLIWILFLWPLLAALMLSGELHRLESSVHADYASEWKGIQSSLWIAWGIWSAAKIGAGFMLKNRRVKSTRWMAAALIWAGSIVAPLIGMIGASAVLSSQMAAALNAHFLLKAIWWAVFALLCSLYLAFSKRVKSTYLASSPAVPSR